MSLIPMSRQLVRRVVTVGLLFSLMLVNPGLAPAFAQDQSAAQGSQSVTQQAPPAGQQPAPPAGQPPAPGQTPPGPAPPPEKPFADVIKDAETVKGLFTLYRKDDKVWLEILPEQFDGGVYHHRDHVGDPNGRAPYEPVPAAKQRQALDLLKTYAFGPKAFDLPPSLLNKLASERNWDFEGSLFREQRLDYPIHQQVLGLQRALLDRLFNPIVLARYNLTQIRGRIQQALGSGPAMNTTTRAHLQESARLSEGQSGENNSNSGQEPLGCNLSHFFLLVFRRKGMFIRILKQFWANAGGVNGSIFTSPATLLDPI